VRYEIWWGLKNDIGDKEWPESLMGICEVLYKDGRDLQMLTCGLKGRIMWNLYVGAGNAHATRGATISTLCKLLLYWLQNMVLSRHVTHDTASRLTQPS
jgi:hypothetical protein